MEAITSVVFFLQHKKIQETNDPSFSKNCVGLVLLQTSSKISTVSVVWDLTPFTLESSQNSFNTRAACEDFSALHDYHDFFLGPSLLFLKHRNSELIWTLF